MPLEIVAEDAQHFPNDLQKNIDFSNLRRNFTREYKEYINDQFRLPIDKGEPSSVPLTIRLCGARLTPDGIIFAYFDSIKGNASSPSLPQGLEVGALLGSSHSINLLRNTCSEQAFGPISSFREKIVNERFPLFYLQYLRALESLSNSPDKDAPAFMDEPAWRIKQLNTMLGSWAQFKHTLLLQEKKFELYAGASLLPAGFVEPVPEFYSRLRKACKSFPIVEMDRQDLGQRMMETVPYIKQWEKFEGKQTNAEFAVVWERINWVMHSRLDIAGRPKGWLSAFFQEAGPRLIENKYLAPDDEETIQIWLKQSQLATRWEALNSALFHLEIVSLKQLRGQVLNNDDESFIRFYGEILGSLHFYDGNSWEIPRDDAPRIADIAQDPNINKVLEVGVGRPLKLLVLYPWKGKDILCRGAVMPYFEFPYPADKRLTDSEFHRLLDSADAPLPPDWAMPVFPAKAALIPAQD